MDSADLYRRDPVAFLLLTELTAHPRTSLTVAEARRITGAPAAATRAALAELVQVGALEPAGRGRYRTPPAATEPAPRVCERCGTPITPPRRRYCSQRCAQATSNARRAATLAAERAATVKRCVVCGTRIPVQPRARHQLYCSRRCEAIRERENARERRDS